MVSLVPSDNCVEGAEGAKEAEGAKIISNR